MDIWPLRTVVLRYAVVQEKAAPKGGDHYQNPVLKRW
jgi:hypothetical protein